MFAPRSRERQYSQRKPNVKKSGERLIRLAYELESLASRLRAAGYESEGNGIRAVSSQIGAVGRTLDEKVRLR